MHPAPSIIIFTTLSGLGFGMLAYLGFSFDAPKGWAAFWFFLIAFALAVGGLVSSTFHLGHPERAIKAFSQWRSSWLSREGVLAVASLLVMGLYAFALVFFGILAYIAIIRWRDRKWIEQRFGTRNLLAMSFGVNYFGQATEPGKPRRSSGFLLLLPDCLFYRSRVKKVELEIPGSRIARVYHDRTHKGIDLHTSLVKVDFISSTIVMVQIHV